MTYSHPLTTQAVLQLQQQMRDCRANRDAQLLRHQLYDARLHIDYTADLAVLLAYIPWGSELQTIIEDHPEVAGVLGISMEGGIEDQLYALNPHGWLIGASRPEPSGHLGTVRWFYADTYAGAMQEAIDWAREGQWRVA